MPVSTLFPNSGIRSRWSGGGINQATTALSSLPASGTTSVAALVKDGVNTPSTSTSWGNQFGTEGFYYFECKLDNLLIEPSSVTFRVAGEAFSVDNLMNVTSLWFLFKKEDNPTLPQDVIIASGQYGLSIFNFTPFGGTQTMSATIPIIEANRASFGSGIGGIPTLSGQIRNNDGNEADNNTLIYDWQVDVSGGDPATLSSNNNITLYLAGGATSSGNITLHTLNSAPSSGNTDLYIEGIGGSNSGIDLYIAGYGTSSGNIDLYTISSLTSSGNTDLYVQGSITTSNNAPLFLRNETGGGSGNMNLFTFGGPIGREVSGNMPLFMYSTDNSGLYSFTSLYLNNSNTFNPLNAMNLTLEGIGYETYTSSMNLVLFQNTEPNNSFDLFIGNYYSSITGSMPLYMAAPSGTEGAVPISGNMNLFINRLYDGVEYTMPLFTKVIEQVSGDLLPLFITGQPVANSSIPLYVFGQHNPNTSLNLYSHGF